jgi:hypothetical protein
MIAARWSESRRLEGVRLGRPVALPAKVERRIQRERAKGKTFAAIADGSNRDNVPTAQGVLSPAPQQASALTG